MQAPAVYTRLSSLHLIVYFSSQLSFLLKKPISMSDELKLQAYQMDDYFAPNRCELCDIPLPDESSRRSHMADTKHCSCPSCKSYVPVGYLYGHISIASVHAKEFFNDHMVAHADHENESKAQPWVGTKDYEKAVTNRG